MKANIIKIVCLLFGHNDLLSKNRMQKECEHCHRKLMLEIETGEWVPYVAPKPLFKIIVSKEPVSDPVDWKV